MMDKEPAGEHETPKQEKTEAPTEDMVENFVDAWKKKGGTVKQFTDKNGDKVTQIIQENQSPNEMFDQYASAKEKD